MNRIVIVADKCKGCKACERACALEHSLDKGPARLDPANTPLPRIKVLYGPGDDFGKKGSPLPLRCRHCDDPKCVTACMAGALRKGEDGVVRHDPRKCVGCWMCVMSCHCGAVFRDAVRKVAVKCDMCPGREVPACVSVCKFEALTVQSDAVGTAPAREQGAVEG